MGLADIVARRPLQFSEKGASRRNDIEVRIYAPYALVKGSVGFEFDPGAAGCRWEIVGLPKVFEDVSYGADSLQALQLASDVEPLLRKLQEKYDLFLFVLILCACGSGTTVSFSNRSAVPLEAVELSGSGFKASLGTVASGQSITARIYPAGESGLAVSFIANDRRYSYGPQDYFEPGGMYKVSVKVDSSLTASVQTVTRP